MLGPLCLLCAVCCSVLQSVGSVFCLVCRVMCCECLYVRARVCVCSSRVQACACVFVCAGSFVSFVCLVRCVLSMLGPSCALGVVSRAVIYGRPSGRVNIHTAFLFKSQLQNASLCSRCPSMGDMYIAFCEHSEPIRDRLQRSRPLLMHQP